MSRQKMVNRIQKRLCYSAVHATNFARVLHSCHSFSSFCSIFWILFSISQGAWRSHPSHANEATDDDWKGSQTCEPVPAKSWAPEPARLAKQFDFVLFRQVLGLIMESYYFIWLATCSMRCSNMMVIYRIQAGQQKPFKLCTTRAPS